MRKLTVNIQGDKLSGWVFRESGKTWVHFEGETFLVEDTPRGRKGSSQSAADQSPDIKAPMPGKVTKVLVAQGEEVSQGQVVVMMEAMKMEYSLKAKCDGVVDKLDCQAGNQVSLGQILLKIRSTKDK